MRKEQPSRTALLIAASLVLLRQDPKYSNLISAVSENFCLRALELHSWTARLFSKLARQRWFRTMAKLVERSTTPGILAHYALRKKCIAKLARDALGKGANQIVILGAGLDALSLELHQESLAARFWEIDHPATQNYKLRVVASFDSNGIHFLPNDFSRGDFNQSALIATGFDSTQRTFWVAEGLLMYLPASSVSALMASLRTLSSAGSQFAFTFMESEADGRIRFHQQTRAVDWWLRARGEPFVWGAKRTELVDFIKPWRVVQFFDDRNLRALETRLSDERLARGEVICLAEA